VGYCQGLNFLAAMLLRHMPAAQAWRVLASLMHAPQYGMADMFSAGLAGVGLSFAQLKALLEAHLHAPRRAPGRAGRAPRHVRSRRVRGMGGKGGLRHTCSLPAGWIMTLFTSLETLPVGYVAPLLGLFILDGWKALFRAILALLGDARGAFDDGGGGAGGG